MTILASLSHISGIYLHDLGSLAFWLSLISIIVIDLVLSGDNAVLIAMACRSLPIQQQRKGIIWGTLGAIILRLVFGSLAVFILMMPFLKATGGLIIAWIAIHFTQEEVVEEVKVSSFWAAVRLIILANAIMSIDNMLGVAGAAHGKPGLLWFGILISIPIVIYSSQLLLTFMQKYSWINDLGAAVLGWTVGSMLISDPLVQEHMGILLPFFWLFNKVIPLILAVGVVLVGQKMKNRKIAKELAKSSVSGQ
jgi:YjbE family integral membrane protein